jgi:putative transposase
MCFLPLKMCEVLEVRKSDDYNWMKAKLSKRRLENKELAKQFRSIHENSKQTYGSPRITEELKALNYKASRPRVARTMIIKGISAKPMKRYKVTTDSRHKFAIAEYKLKRDFNSSEMGKALVSDITYIKTQEGWLYLTTVLDVADRKMIVCALSSSMHASKTTVPALRMAVRNRTVTPGLIFHSDSGV